MPKNEKTRLSRDHYKFLLDIRDGADIMGYGEARCAREIERARPSWIDITDRMGDYNPAGRLPYLARSNERPIFVA